MAAGEYRDQIRILTKASGQDAAGQPLAQWQESSPIWADARMIGGERERALSRTARPCFAESGRTARADAL